MRRQKGAGHMARLTDRQFLKAQIDLEPLGLIMDGPFEAYFCTPKGARIFARSGVDGIHFCFVRGFGETVFAVSPMNGRDGCVHPVAKSFRDFLRLLLALHDAAAIEQAWQWDAAQLEEFEQKHPSSDEQLAALDKLVFTFHLRPMAEPWKYIHTVQSGFDYGKLRFSEEFYDNDENAFAQEEPWQVTFEGNFWGAHGKPGKELRLGASFSWAGDEWLVPAAYVCREGIVLDIARRVPVEKLFSFRETWGLSPENDGSDWDEVTCIRARAESPFSERLGAELTVNGQTLRQERGCSLCWDPLYAEGNGRENKRVREHYGLDELDGWYIERISFPWKGKKKADIQSLSLHVWENPIEVPGQEFSPEKAGDSITFTLPGAQQTHTLTVLALHTEELPLYGETVYTTELAYDIAPELPDGSVTLRDFAEAIRVSPQGDFSGCAFGVIGGADGPVALAMGRDIACSQVRREKERRVTWTLVFREKRKEDKTVTLLDGQKERIV